MKLINRRNRENISVNFQFVFCIKAKKLLIFLPNNQIIKQYFFKSNLLLCLNIIHINEININKYIRIE